MRPIALLFVALALTSALAPDTTRAVLAAVPAVLQDGGTARVAQVVDGDTVTLEDGRQVRLVGIQAPKLPLGRAGFQSWPLADTARQALAELVEGRAVELGFGTRREDRHGRLLAQLYAGELWVQGEMLRRGLARVYTFADNRLLAAEMLSLEKEARADHRGLWGEPFYRVRQAGSLEVREAGSFALVEGQVLQAEAVGPRFFLNFGADYHTDFTAVIGPHARKLFTAAGIDPAGFAGRLVRVRGWIESYNGPMIDITHPEQIELAP
jgi:endonuclease YncB( thermonuclease family)